MHDGIAPSSPRFSRPHTQRARRNRSLQRISTHGDITGKAGGRYTLLTLVRFNLVLYLRVAGFSCGIMLRERDLGHHHHADEGL